ncbi:hypothetical protein C8Q80DRAFT_1241168 [Daedaleopsis nitida]|nr:hypothetical protein C8Q80DRAFT_1241168 [Daedaleopsis nitida]
MYHKIVVVKQSDFMDFFVPVPSESHRCLPRRDVFHGLRIFQNESQMYHDIPSRLNKKKRGCHGYTIVATLHKGDNAVSSTLAPDCGFYPADHAPATDKKQPYGRTDWSYLEIPVECKRDPSVDPFEKNVPCGEPLSEGRKSCLRQILSDSELLFLNQHRMFHFLILFLGHYARILRIDRSGIFATERFDYVKEEDKLTDFLWQYSCLSPEQRGHDPTVERIDPAHHLAKAMREKVAEAKRNARPDAGPAADTDAQPTDGEARFAEANAHPANAAAHGHATDVPTETPEDEDGDDEVLPEPQLASDDGSYIADLFDASLDEKRPWWRLEVHDELTGTIQSFVAGKPHFLAAGVQGRGTRGYVALPLKSDGTLGDCFVYLKDAWRVNHPTIQKEGTTLKHLNDNGVRYIPTLLCHGDLPSQVTESPERWKQLHPGNTPCPLKEHQHYRIVVKEVGKPLSHFKNSSQLVIALFHCVLAHQDAFELAGFIHRDISAGNILLYYNEETGFWQGILTDWELAQDVTKTEVRQTSRTGTWQFMSANVQDKPTRVVVIPDELESIFHVLIFYGVRFLRHNLDNKSVGRFLHDYFDDYWTDSEGTRCGAAKRYTVMSGTIDLIPYNHERTAYNRILQFIWPSLTSPEDTARDAPDFSHPLNDLINTLLAWFQAHYTYVKPVPRQPAVVDHPTCAVSTVTSSEDPRRRGSRARSQLHRAQAHGTDSPHNSSNNPSAISATETAHAPGSTLNVQTAPSQQVTDATGKADLAHNLHTHHPMACLLYDSLKTVYWPKDDKVEDKRPKKRLAPKSDPVPSGTWYPPRTSRRMWMSRDTSFAPGCSLSSSRWRRNPARILRTRERRKRAVTRSIQVTSRHTKTSG